MERRKKNNLVQTARIIGFFSVFALAGLAFFLLQSYRPQSPADRFVIRNDTDYEMEVTLATGFDNKHNEVFRLKPGESARTHSLGERASSIDRLQTALEKKLVRFSFRIAERDLSLEGVAAAGLIAANLRRDPEDKGGNISLQLKPVLNTMTAERKKLNSK